jgi:hypothetical protein
MASEHTMANMSLLRPGFVRSATCAACCAVAAGCVTINKAAPIQISDAADTAALHTVWRFDPQAGHGIELEVSRQRGRDTTVLGAAERVQLGNTVILGPRTLATEADVRTWHVAYNRLLRGRGPLEFEFYAGAGRMDVDLELDGGAPGTRLRRGFGGGSLVLGIAPRWKLGERWALEGRLSTYGGWNSDSGYDRDSVALALAFRPVPQLGLQLGYAWSHVEIERDGLESNVRVSLYGPFAGLALAF